MRMNRAMLRQLKKLGVKLQQLDGVQEVKLVFEDHVIKLVNPAVTVMLVGGQKIYQIVAEGEEREEVEGVEEVEIPEEDIALVMAQTGASREEAEAALRQTGGDLAAAILLLRGQSV